MKYLIKYLVILLLLIVNNCYAIENQLSGAKSKALSNAVVSISDSWSTFHNQAGIADFKNPSLGIYYESRFLINDLSQVSGSIILPTKSGVFGLSFSQFGKGLYKELKTGLAYSKKLSKNLSTGIQFDYFTKTLPENNRGKNYIIIEGGIIYRLNNNLVLGAHLFNPLQTKLKTFSGLIKIPVIFRIGGDCQLSEILQICFEIEKKSKKSLLYKSGIEFIPINGFVSRFGFSGKPFNFTWGFGYTSGIITADIAFSYHGNLGITPSVSIQFRI